MSSSGIDIPLRWKLQVEGAQEAKARLQELNQQFQNGEISVSDYAKGQREALRDVRALNNEQRVQKEVFLASNPALNSFIKTMSTFGSVANTALSITNAMNLAFLASSQIDDGVSSTKQKLADDLRALAKLMQDSPNDLAGISAALNQVQVDQDQLAKAQQKATYQMIQNWVTVGASVFLVAGQIGQLIANKDSIRNSLASMTNGIPDNWGTVSLAVVAVGAAALALSSIIGDQVNPAFKTFKQNLETEFGNNWITDYILAPLLAIPVAFDQATGGSAQTWDDFVRDATTNWVNFVNQIISGVNYIHQIMRSVGLGSVTVGDFALLKTPSQIAAENAQKSNADRTNQFLIGSPNGSTQTTNPNDLQQKIIQQALSMVNGYKKAMTDALNESPTQQKQTDNSKNLLDSVIGSTNPTLNAIKENSVTLNQAMTSQNQYFQTLIDQYRQTSQQQTQTRQTLENTLTTLQAQAAELAKLPQTQTISGRDDILASQLGVPGLAGDGPAQYITTQVSTQAAKDLADVNQKIADTQRQLQEVGNPISLAGYLSGIGMSSNYGVGSVVSQAVGLGGGLTDADIQEFLNTHDYGVFTRADIRDNTTAPTSQATPQGRYQSLISSLTSQGFSAAQAKASADSAAAKSHGQIHAATGFEGIVGSPTSFLAGEAGPEKVSIKPLGSSSNGTIINNYYTIQGSVWSDRELAKKISNTNKINLKTRGFAL